MTTDPREALREMIAEVAQREFENSITTDGAVAFRDYLGSRIAAEVMCLFPDDVEIEEVVPFRGAAVHTCYVLRTAPEPKDGDDG